MGRGRAKAKQTKVARDLKYRTWDTDLDQLKRELSGDGQAGSKPNGGEHGSADDDETDDYDDGRRY